MVLIRDALSICGFRRPLTLHYGPVLADSRRQLDPGAKLFAYLDDWYVWIKPQDLLQTFALIAAATRSVNLELQPSNIQTWRASCQDPIPPELQDKIKLTLSCLGGHLQIHGDIELSPIVPGCQITWKKPHNVSSGSPPRLPTSMQKDSTRRQ